MLSPETAVVDVELVEVVGLCEGGRIMGGLFNRPEGTGNPVLGVLASDEASVLPSDTVLLPIAHAIPSCVLLLLLVLSLCSVDL